MRTLKSFLLLAAAMVFAVPMQATIEGSLDPESVVEEWSDDSTSPQIIDINFSDTSWPDTWAGTTGTDCPSYTDGGYVNAIISVPANGSDELTYPVLFHNCTFATQESYNGYAGATAAFCRQYYNGSSANGSGTSYSNDWTQTGHTTYLEDNITYDTKGTPNYGEAGFVQMCRDAASTIDGEEVSMHGWMEIDHLPYVERIQWSWSSTAWGRGIKCDYKVGDGEWTPLVWMGYGKHKIGYTSFSDQGYFMENVIDASDVSFRWRVWDGEREGDPVQTAADGSEIFTTYEDPMAQQQAPRVHKLRIFGNELTADDADYALNNQVSDVGELSDLDAYEDSDDDSSSSLDVEAPVSDILAFPTAEGFGKYATGGRGGQVVYVTSLEDDGSEGTLRWAVEQYPDEPLTIVFAVSGQITLTSQLSISRSDWTLAGQTAPGDGIVIARNKVNMGGSENFIVRNVRFRAGAYDTDGASLMDNAVGAENCANYIFDHCSFGWSVEENMNTADSHFLTVQYSMVHEGLYDGGHSKGARGYGSQWGGSPATYHHNLLANNYSRSPRFNGARGEDYLVFIEYVNNVNYNFGKSNACYGGENTADINEYNELNSAHECNFMSNYYKTGAAYTDASSVVYVSSSYARSGATSWAPAQWYVDGNVIEGNETGTSDNWKAMAVETYSLDQIKSEERIVPENAYYKYSVVGNSGTYEPSRYMMYDFETAEQAFTTVVDEAGTVNRDKVEQRIADEAKNGTYTYSGSKQSLTGIIDLESDAEGFFDYSADYTVPADSDSDGMPDDWETANGLDPTLADQNTANVDGYTALEVYLNGLMGEELSTNFSTPIGSVSLSAPSVSYSVSSSTLSVSDNAIGATLRAYSTDGRLLLTKQIDSQQTDLTCLPSGIVLLQVEGSSITPRVLKVTK